ncbi:MAG: L,D-transpeptidase family protein [Ancalomicrobiaceae bacterium]|nr:L,D-transpeptidase family protein [Ancalomicrobiaceae bacterium]
MSDAANVKTLPKFSRRTLLAGTAAAWAFRATGAFAEDPTVDQLVRGQQKEWQDKFDNGAATPVSELKSDHPLLSPDTAGNIEAAIPIMQDIVAKGGWPKVPDRQRLKIGSRLDAVVKLRQRLTISSDLPPQQVGYSDIFDSYVDAAVKRFQVRHGLMPTGIVDQPLFNIMNVSAETRLQQLETNLIRVRSMSGFLGDRYVFVNIPAAELEAVEGGRVVARHNAVVGKIDAQTPILTSKIQEVTFYPYWNVPVSIIRKDLIPEMKKDPDYLTKEHIRILDTKGHEIPPSSINWDSDEASKYWFRQDPGEINAMATIKITFPNPYDVYMHDTPFRNLFGENGRFYSHGCMRIQNVRELVGWLLRDTPPWTLDQIDATIAAGTHVEVKLKAAVPVYTNYITAWATREGIIHFRDDIYGRDGIGELAQLANVMEE